MAKYTKLSNTEKLSNAADKLAKQIIDLIENGETPNAWLKPWIGAEPQGLFSPAPYKGYNVLWTEIYNKTGGFKSQYFITIGKLIKMAKEKGVFIDVKELYTNEDNYLTVTFYKPIVYTDKETEEQKRYFVLETYNVINIEQVPNYKEFFASELAKLDSREEIPVADVNLDEFFQAYMKNQNVTFGFHKNIAGHLKADSHIVMPDISQFLGQKEYYAVLGHEIIHSTGPRLGRSEFTDKVIKGSVDYSKEELVAEFGAMILAEKLNYDSERIYHNSKEYLLGWAQVFKNDPMIILQAVKEANKAVEFIFDCVANQTKELIAA